MNEKPQAYYDLLNIYHTELETSRSYTPASIGKMVKDFEVKLKELLFYVGHNAERIGWKGGLDALDKAIIDGLPYTKWPPEEEVK